MGKRINAFFQRTMDWSIPLLIIAALLGLPGGARADTVASLLGNFTINQFARLQVGKNDAQVHFVVVMGQLPALKTLHDADTNDDGVTSQAERDAYLKGLAPTFAKQLEVSADGRNIPLHLTTWTSSLPSEASGFSLRFDARYTGELPAGLNRHIKHLNFDNTNYSGRIGWHEIVVAAAPGISIFNTNAVSTSVTKGLSINPEKLPPGGPLDERAVHLAFTQGPPPAGVTMLQPRPGYPAATHHQKSTSGLQSTGVAVTWLNRATKRLVDLISARHINPAIGALALLFSLILGALHAFSPGHGKTVVGAYLVGSRGTARHAAFLGLTVTVTHTIGVFAVGLATLFASRFIVPEKLFPILGVISGLLVVIIGSTMFVRRLRGVHGHTHDHGDHDHHHEHGLPHTHSHTSAATFVTTNEPDFADAGAHGHQHLQPHDHHHHGHEHHHDHAHSHGALTHSHGGRVHTHLPPGAHGEPISWRSLLGLGISGGLIPCPSAMVLLLATISLHKTAYGLILVLAFSVGLAMTLTAVGLVFLYARRWVAGRLIPGRMVQAMPVLSAGIITCVGLVICYGAVVGGGIAI